MKKYLLSFLLISLTIISDGYAGSCKAYSKRGANKNTDNDFLDLMCEENKKTEAVSDGYTGYDVEKFDYWGIDCVTDEDSCSNDQYVIVWGPHRKGNETGREWKGVDIYQCVDKSDDEWVAKTTGSTKAYQLIQDCGSSIDGMEKIIESNGYNIYVRKINSFDKCETKAYTFGGMSNTYICKKKIEKKCGQDPSDFYFSDRLFCPEEGVMKVYKPLYFNNERVWYDITYDGSIKISSCEDKPFGSDWKNWGKWTTVLSVFVKQADAFASASEATGLVFGGYNIRIDRPKDFCLWCEDTNMTPRKDGDTVVCVNETEYDGGGDSGGGDSSPEPQVEEEFCGGVKCNSSRNGKSVFCAEDKNDTFVYKCESGRWNEVDVYGYCCNKNCSKPKKTNFVLGGSWTPDSNHEMWFSPTALIKENAWLFNSTDVNNNCTACKEGTKYNKNSGKCEQ